MTDSHERARAAVRRLRDGLSRELAGLNEDAPEQALRYAVEALERELRFANSLMDGLGQHAKQRRHGVSTGEFLQDES